MPKVIIIGGGVAGMSAAHELIERGFETEVYDRHKTYSGGKARSVDVHLPGQGENDPLPGEHGFRFFPGFYKHIIDTMKRIPVTKPDGRMISVSDNLVPTSRVRLTRFGKPSIISIVNFPRSFDDIRTLFESMHANTGLTTEEKETFAKKVWQLMTSCYERRAFDYEKLSWWDYMEADKYSQTYRDLFVQGLTRTLVAANAKYASTKTGGDIFLQLLFNMTTPGVQTDRVLNAPTNQAWLVPWLSWLQSKGVNYFFHSKAEEIKVSNGRVDAVIIRDEGTGETKTVRGDYYILAVPVERAARLISKEMLNADPSLEGIMKLAPSVAWMNGIQYYLTKDIEVVRGHCIYSDSPWALTSISQLQFWDNYPIMTKGNGKVRGILSIDVSDWDTPGFNGKPAKDCSHTEIKEEIWAQLKASLNTNGQQILTDDMLVDWHIDGDIKQLPHEREKNEEPLLVNTVNSWNLRPEAYTSIPNLFLASDYVRTFTDLATMEGANEAARRAVNGIIQASGTKHPLCEIWNLHEPRILAIARAADKERFDKGLPYRLYVPGIVSFFVKIIRDIKKIFGIK